MCRGSKIAGVAIIALTAGSISSQMAMAQNPLAQKQDDNKPFSGNFTGKDISLDMNYDSQQGGYTGWLTFKGKKYACGGWASNDNNQFTGQFVADGEKYPFTIASKGGQVILSSAGQDYELSREKKAPANPLAVGAVIPPAGGAMPAGGPVAGPGAGNPNAVGGIGVRFREDDGDFVIDQIMPNSPAAQAGVKRGDTLMAVNGKSVDGLKMEQVRDLIVGPPGSKVTLRVEDDNNNSREMEIVRADLSAAGNGQAPPAPNPPPPMMPGQPPEGPAPNFSAPAPGNNGQVNAGQAWLKPGLRITYWGGSATIAHAGTVLVPDGKGGWINQGTGEKFGEADNPGGGGMGFMQLDVTDVANGVAVVDMHNYLYHTDTQACSSIGLTGYVGPAGSCGDYWLPPQQLAQMQSGNTGPVNVMKMQYPLNGKTYNAVRVVTQTGSGYTQSTYDLDSGLLLVQSLTTTGAAVVTPGPNGQAGTAEGNTMLVQSRLVNMRQLNLPWIGQHADASLANLKRINFSGTYETTIPGTIKLPPWLMAQQWDLSKIDPVSLQIHQAVQLDYRQGGPPQTSASDRACSIGSIWLDPKIQAQLKPGQVLDDDPITKQRMSVAGVQNGMTIITWQGKIENSAVGYDQQTGLLSAVQLQQIVAPATTTISLQRTR